MMKENLKEGLRKHYGQDYDKCSELTNDEKRELILAFAVAWDINNAGELSKEVEDLLLKT